MNLSGILVVCPVSGMESTITALAALPGVEVHQMDRQTGRIVVTQEAESIRDEMDGLCRIKAIPNVILAEMVYHHFEDDPEISGVAASDPMDEQSTQVPTFLRD